MPQRFGFDRVVDDILDDVEARLVSGASFWAQCELFGETPIERLFIFSLQCSIQFLQQDWFKRMVVCGSDKVEVFKAHDGFEKALIVERQAQLPDWRVDFVVHHWATWERSEEKNEPRWRRLIVECDGHDFHERTKEQAARDRSRDRAAQMSGIEVFRFTGSELWRNPINCAAQVIAWANKGV